MKALGINWAVVGILMLGGCAVIDMNHSANLAQYKSFGWGKSDKSLLGPIYKSELIEANVKSTIKAEFEKKGLAFISKKPDVLVSYQVITERKERSYGGSYYYYPYYSYWYFPYGRYMMGWPMVPYGGMTPGYYTYTEGTLILNVIDRKTNRLVWRGLVHGSVDNIKSLNKTVTKGIKAVIKKYPAVPPALIPLPKEKIS